MTRVATVEPLLPQRCCFSLTSFTKSGSVSQSSSDIEYRKWSKLEFIYSSLVRIYFFSFTNCFLGPLFKEKKSSFLPWIVGVWFSEFLVLICFCFLSIFFFGCFCRCDGGKRKDFLFLPDSRYRLQCPACVHVCVSAILYVGTSVRACVCTYASRDERLGVAGALIGLNKSAPDTGLRVTPRNSLAVGPS